MAVVVLGLLAALVWVLRPSRPHFAPAALEPPPADCPKLQREFIPTNVTGIPDPALRDLTPKQRNRALYRLNTERCTCGCNLSIIACRLSHPHCEISKKLLEKIVAEVKAEDARSK
jgi:hypothetical protein